MRFATALLFCVSTVGFAGSWTGQLVDSRCWASRETNVSADAPLVNHNLNSDIRQCAPTDDTKRFAVVTNDWRRFKLDSTGNARAYQLAQQANWHVPCITVTGVLTKKTIHVSSIAPATVKKR
jgi:hypothetical protein